MLQLFNTATRKKQSFLPSKPPYVTLYTCGPTVYNFLTLGNLRTYVFEDIARRTLNYNGFRVRHIMNITDVGHLTSDADTGEDKIQKQAEQKRETAWEIANRYTEAFQKDFQELHILPPSLGFVKATNHIREQIALIRSLEKKGYTYRIKDGVYFDTKKFSRYADFARLDTKQLKEGARVEIQKEKRYATDFALWKFSPKDAKRDMEWDSPWGKGFPGWHIECSAMAMKHLSPGTFNWHGDFHPEHFRTIDIHTGGIDHIPVHHTNEIAQSEAATGKTFVHFWLHGAFLLLQEKRMGKSEGNMITLQTLKSHGFWPLVYRYLLLQTHYRSPMQFSWDSLQAAKTGLFHLYRTFLETKMKMKNSPRLSSDYRDKFVAAMNDDLNTPQAVAVLWSLIRDEKVLPEQKIGTLLDWDRILGLEFEKESKKIGDIPTSPTVRSLQKERKISRRKKDYIASDRLRDILEKTHGYTVLDQADGNTMYIPSVNLWRPQIQSSSPS